jgi:hypothetical protein
MVKQVRITASCLKVLSLARRKFGKPATFVSPLIIGGYNILYSIQIEGFSNNVLVRILYSNQANFPEEKILAEVATAVYIS